MRLSVVTPATLEPLTLQEAKAHLRVDFAKEDAVINSLIAGARQAFERDTPRRLLTVTLKWFIDRFPQFDREPLFISAPPLLTVAAVKYFDVSGVEQTWDVSEYTVQAFAGPFSQRGMLSPKPDFSWPQTRWMPNAVTIDFDAGYGAAQVDVPFEIKEALFGWIGAHYNGREGVIEPWPGFAPWRDAGFA